jgi:hypothetical protein
LIANFPRPDTLALLGTYTSRGHNHELADWKTELHEAIPGLIRCVGPMNKQRKSKAIKLKLVV